MKDKERVRITYDIESNGSIESRSLPFVIGVMGDYVGNASPYLKHAVEQREFIPITKDNIDNTLSQLKPTIQFKVDNCIDPGSDKLDIHLAFTSLKDFDPINIIQQVPELRELYELRQQLRLEQQKALLED